MIKEIVDTVYSISDHESVKALVLNGMTLNEFLAYTLFAVFGIMLNMVSNLIKLEKIDVKKTNDWFMKNRLKILLSIIFVPVIILLIYNIFNIEITNSIAFIIGYSVDHVLEILKQKGFMSVTKIDK